MEGESVAATVLRTGRTARMDDYSHAAGPLAARLRELGVRSRVGAPIVVAERVWGLAVVGTSRPEPLPSDAEDHIAEFAGLVAMAIAATTTRAELIASRARVIAAADDARRRLERDLHDGIQQQLVSLALRARVTEEYIPAERVDLKTEFRALVLGLSEVTAELRELSRGIHPAILSEGGLAPALKGLARRSPLPIDVDIAIEERLPDSVEVATYYVAAEALTNAAKHAHASAVSVRAQTKDGALSLSIHDNGIGGADLRKGSGLIGLKDRVEALGGQMKVTSPPGNGTTVDTTIPIRTM
jgi:signal transduction histidine kinase